MTFVRCASMTIIYLKKNTSPESLIVMVIYFLKTYLEKHWCRNLERAYKDRRARLSKKTEPLVVSTLAVLHLLYACFSPRLNLPLLVGSMRLGVFLARALRLG